MSSIVILISLQNRKLQFNPRLDLSMLALNNQPYVLNMPDPNLAYGQNDYSVTLATFNSFVDIKK